MKYIPVIGLEIHAELLTKSKVFCSCQNEFGGDANTRVCPVCTGMPGAMPVINKNAVKLAVKAGLAFNCNVNEFSAFDRKNYFYPDLPKAYQITQFEHPICSGGFIDIEDKNFRIERIHIEEDAGKLIHDSETELSLADYNRCGVPLIEIVTMPDFSSADEVKSFVEEIALRLKYADVCDARLEQGSLRVDVNISLMEDGSDVLGTRAEIKNLNSFRSISKAISYEIKRQTEILSSGGIVVQETRRFDEDTGTTSSLRSKEEAHDYRYFPEPDIPPVVISEQEIASIKNEIPKMPHLRKEEYKKLYSLSDFDAGLIVSDIKFSDFFEAAAKIYGHGKEISKLMLGTLNKILNETGKSVSDAAFNPMQLAELVKMSTEEKISKNSAKNILEIMFVNGKNPMDIATENNMLMENNTDELFVLIKKVIDENPDAVNDYRSGNVKSFGFLMGQLVRAAGKGVNPQLAKELLSSELK